MSDFELWNDPTLEADLWRLYRQFFDKAERKRRWCLETDIPWDAANKNIPAAIADIVESFCVVELYLPDYLRSAIPKSRPSRARSWFYANWGYEESKHSLALGDWLVRSGMRTESQIADIASKTFQDPWTMPHASIVAMVGYTMVQERATALIYRNLRRHVQSEASDPALEQLLKLLSVDEQTHYSFFQDFIRLFLERDRDLTLEHLRRVMHTFDMPALHLLADSSQRMAQIRDYGLFTEEQFFCEVYEPILKSIGVQRSEMRNRQRTRKSAPTVEHA